MVKIRYLYHGSPKKLSGEKLIPKKPHDLEKKTENLYRGIYATNIKGIAIAMAIISCKGVLCASLSFNKKPFGIIYDGWPKQKYFYLYILSSNNFKRTSQTAQWVSKKPVKPFKIEKLAVKDYLYLIRKATKKEKENWFKKHGE